MIDIRKEMKERAQLTRGLVNVLKDEAEYICTDVNNNDIFCLNESLREAKDTIQKLVDNVTELDHLLYLIKREEA